MTNFTTEVVTENYVKIRRLNLWESSAGRISDGSIFDGIPSELLVTEEL